MPGVGGIFVAALLGAGALGPFPDAQPLTSVPPAADPWQTDAAAGAAAVPFRPLLHLDGDDATWATLDLATWPARVGPAATLLSGCGKPQKDAALANGHQGLAFTGATATVLSLGNLKASATELTGFLVFRSNCYKTTASAPCDHRAYCLRNIGPGGIDADDTILACLANLTPANAHVGYFDATQAGDELSGGWHLLTNPNFRGVANKVAAKSGLQVVAWSCGAGGCRFWRNGAFLGSNSRFNKRLLNALKLGGTYDGSCVVPDVTGPEMTVFAVKVYDVALPDAAVLLETTAFMQRFGITVPTTPKPPEIFGANLKVWYDATSEQWLEYNSNLVVSAWANRLDTASHLLTASGSPSYDSSILAGRGSVRVNRNPSVDAFTGNSVATAAMYPGGNLTGPGSIIVVAQQVAGNDSTDGPLAAFGKSNSTVNRWDCSWKSSATTHVRSVAIQPDSVQSRNSQPTGQTIGTTPHVIICTQNETTDLATVQFDGGSITTSTTVNLATTPIDTFAVGSRSSNGALSGNGFVQAYLCWVMVLDAEPTTQQRTDILASAQAYCGVP